MRFFLSFLLTAGYLAAIQHSGSIRAADQFLPGVTVTARQGGARLVTCTDESGRYTLDLTPGFWEIQVDIFGFVPASTKIDIGSEPTTYDWTLEMPRAGVAPASPLAASPAASLITSPPAAASLIASPAAETIKPAPAPIVPAPSVQAPSAQARKPQPAAAAFQNMSVKATADGDRALAATAAEPPPPEIGGDTDSFVVNGSMSGGLAAAADEQTRRERQGTRGAGNSGAQNGISDMAAMGAGAGGDALGLGGFGAGGVQNGFGDGMGGLGGGGARGFGAGGPGGAGGVRGGNAVGNGGGNAGGPGGGGRGGRGGANQAAGRRGRPGAPQFAAFGNRRQNLPTYTGSLAFTGRNSVLDAKPFSLNGQNAAKSSYGQNTFAFNIGGPIRLPKINSNDRLAFYFTYQGSRARSPYNALSTMPSAAERGGDFSQAAVAGGPVGIYDPSTGAPFPGNVIPVSRFNPVSAGLLKFFPLPTYQQLAVQNYQIVTSSKASSDNYGFRQNLPLSRKDRINVNFNYQTRTGNSPTLLGFRDASDGSGFNSSLGYSRSFAPRFNSNLTWNFSRSTGYAMPYFAYSANVAQDLGISGTTQEAIAYGPPNLSFTNFGGLADGAASISRNQTSTINEGITLVRKRHNMTFGIGYTRLQQNPMNYANARGSFSFSGLLTSGFDQNGSPLKGTGFDFADFLLGFPQSSSLQFGAKSNYFRTWNINGFAQDDWRVRPGLSINIGLRYEYFSPYTELFGRMANLDLNSTITAASVVTPGEDGPFSGPLPTSLIRPDTNNLSPRFGFAWRPIPKKALTFRGGYSIFYNGSAYGSFAARMASQPPFVRSASLSTSSANRLTLQNGFAAAPSQTITNNYAIDPNYHLGYAQTWTFAMQESLPHNSIIEFEYIGTKGTGLDILRQPNRATPGSPLTAAQRLQIGNATGFSFETSQGSSIMHMGQVRLTRRLVRGMSAVATYGFQKSLDNASTFGGGGGAVAQNDQNLRLERGLSSFDQRHHFNFQYVLTSPVGGAHGFLRGKGLSRKLLESWTLNGGFNATSGMPLTARVSGNLANTSGTAAFGSGRAQATGLPVQGGSFFNLLAFTTPPPGQFGNAGRNTIPGLFQTSLNASLGRAFRLAESKRQVTVRLSTNNVLNHTVITNIGTTVNSATYGLPTAASATRSVYLTVRLSF